MATSSFNVQDMPFSRLLQLPEDNRDYDSLQNFKPMTDYSINHQHYQPDYYNFSELIESACSSSASYLNESVCEQQTTITVDVPQVDSTLNPSTRKRKGSFRDTISDYEESIGDDSKSVKTTDESKKQNHSEIEKRRRDKMNTYITELSSMVPMCSAMSRKLDKLTVLRMAVQHLKSIKGAVHSYTEGQYKPSFLSDSELKHLILQIADGFLFVVGCDRGKILFVSESVSKVLSFTKGELLGQSLFDVLHPKDVAKVKEQLTSSDLNPRERLIDAKTMLPVKTDVPQGTSRLCPGARRSFFCRMKNKIPSHDAAGEETDSTGNYQQKKTPVKRYSVIHCTGYLKSWPPSKVGLEEGEHEGDTDPDNLSCLVAIGRVLPPISSIVAPTEKKSVNVHPIQFISRHSLDGKFLFVDQRATLVLGFLPQELLGSSMYEYYHQDDIPLIAECHRGALQAMEPVKSQVYRFRSKDDGFIKLQSEIRAFRNPWTDEIEYIIAKNDFVHAEPKAPEGGKEQYETLEENYEFLSPTSSNTIQKIINIHVEASNIGRHIVDQATLDHQQQWEDNSLENSQADESNSLHLPESEEVVPTCAFPENEFSLNCGIETNRPTPLPTPPNDTATSHPSQRLPQNAGELPNGGICESSDGNDEAAMAVIMSLLEADAGLGGPVDFSGLPWPLP